MAAQRRYGRFMGLAMISSPLLVAAATWASPAQADAASYLNDLHKARIHDVDGGDPALMQVAQKPFIVPIPGTRKLARLEENLASASLELELSDLAEIRAVAESDCIGARGILSHLD